jgi:hypothetical protein
LFCLAGDRPQSTTGDSAFTVSKRVGMMRRQAMIATILIVSLLLTGCYTTKRVPAGEGLPRKTTTVDGVVLKSGETVMFSDHDGTFEPVTGHILGRTADGTLRLINQDDVDFLILRKKEPISWTLAGLLLVTEIVIAVAAIIAAGVWHDDHWIVVN